MRYHYFKKSSLRQRREFNMICDCVNSAPERSFIASNFIIRVKLVSAIIYRLIDVGNCYLPTKLMYRPAVVEPVTLLAKRNAAACT